MPEDDVASELADEDEFWAEVEEIARRRQSRPVGRARSKVERWGVEDKTGA